MRKITKLAFLSLVILISACDNSNAMSEAEVEKIVENYIKNNPQIIIDSVNSMREKEEAAEEEKAGNYLKQNYSKITNDPNSATFGNQNGSKIVVEYFDYNCGYCKRVFPTLVKLAEDNDVKVVLKELPVLGPSSELAARFAIVVHKKAPERYFDFHQKLMDHKGQKSPESLLAIAEAAGVGHIDFEKEVKSQEIIDVISNNHAEAAGLTISGTPGFVIGKKIVRGAVDLSTMKSILGE